MKKCTKCNGTGKVGFDVDNGICYKCEGAGFIGASIDEINKAIETRETKNLRYKTINGLASFVNKKVTGNNYPDTCFSHVALNLKGNAFSINVKVSEAQANLFETTYTDTFTDIHECINPSTDTLSERIALTGKFATIEKIGPGLIKVTIN